MESISCEYLTIAGPAEAEYEISRSRFIANIALTKDEAEASAYIESLRKKYWDARHNCAASLIGSRGEYQKADDDGEPSGTAGRPMLEVLKKQGVFNVTCVVTRYFGGIKLGAGGLVRAYTKSVQLALDASQLIKRVPARRIKIAVSYDLIGNIEYYLRQNNISILEKDYGAEASFTLAIEEENAAKLQKELADLSAGRCAFKDEAASYIDVALKK